MLEDAEYGSVFLYCAGLGHVMSGSLVKGLTHFVSIIRKNSDLLYNSGNEHSLVFASYAAMQAALIAEFNLHHDHALMSFFAEKAVIFAKHSAEIKGLSDTSPVPIILHQAGLDEKALRLHVFGNL